MLTRFTRVLHNIRAAQKFILSWFKRQDAWTLEDYPVWTRELDVESFSGPERLRPARWFATIENWCLSGVGDTETDALEKLATAFEYQKKNRSELPRPGRRVPIEFASDEKISRVQPALYNDFVHRVLGLEWAVITDESSLWDFHSEESNEPYIAKVRDIYGVDVSNVPGANVAMIMEKLAAAKN